MKTVWKFPIVLGELIEIEMPAEAAILRAGIQDGNYFFWAFVNTEQPMCLRRFRILGTGHQLPEGMGLRHYVGTIQDGQFVWHIFSLD